MSSAADGHKVQIHYTGRLDDGTVFDSSEGRDPLAFVVGSGEVIDGFDAAVRGMQVGEKKSAVIPPEQAYGDPRDELVHTVPRSQLPEDVSVGDWLAVQSEGQTFPVRVNSLGDESAEIDLNHQLAGKTLHFEITLVSIDAPDAQ